MLLGLLAEYAVLDLEGDKLLTGAQPVTLQLSASGQSSLQPVTRSSRPGALAPPPACAPDKQLWHLMPAQPQLEEWLSKAAAGADSSLAPCCDPAPQASLQESAVAHRSCEQPASSANPAGSLQRQSTGASTGRQSASDLAGHARIAAVPINDKVPMSGGSERLPSSSMSVDTGARSLSSDTTVSQLSRTELRRNAESLSMASVSEIKGARTQQSAHAAPPASTQAGDAATCTDHAANSISSPVLDQ